MPHSPHTVFAIFLTVSYSRAAHSKTRYTNPNYIQQHSSNHDATQKFSSKDQSPEPLCNIETTIEPSLNFSPNMFNMLSKIAALPSSKCSAISPYILAAGSAMGEKSQVLIPTKTPTNFCAYGAQSRRVVLREIDIQFFIQQFKFCRIYQLYQTTEPPLL